MLDFLKSRLYVVNCEASYSRNVSWGRGGRHLAIVSSDTLSIAPRIEICIIRDVMIIVGIYSTMSNMLLRFLIVYLYAK